MKRTRDGRCAGRFFNRVMLLGASSIVVAAATAAPAAAQVFDDVVVVTAQKREQDQQDVGIAITAFNGDQLAALGYTNAQDVANLAPSVVAVQPNGEGSYSFAIRGVANNDLSSNVESPVAVYVDEVYVSQMSAAGFLLFDVEGVAVLRGPQGTLFGRNATGGLVQYTTVRPSSEFGGYGTVSYGDYNDMLVEGAVNLPIAEGISARVSAANHTGTGYITNRLHPEEKLNNSDDYAVRLQLLAELSDDFSILLNARKGGQEIRTGFFEYRSAINGGGIYTPGEPNPLFDGYDDTDGDVWAGDYDTQGHNISRTEGYTATINWTIGGWDVTSITDSQYVFRDYIEDTDDTPYHWYDYFQTNEAEQFSQELRAARKFDDLNVVGGLYYLDLSSKDSTGGIAPLQYATYNGYTEQEALTDTTLVNGDRTPSTSSTKAFSVFGQAEYNFLEQFTVIAGLRWNTEDKDFDSAREDIHFDEHATSGLDPYAIVINTLSEFDPDPRTFDMWAWRLQFNYQPTSDMLLYASYNRGVKSGGFSQPPYDPMSDLLVDPELLVYDPEELDAYEVGVKWDVIPGNLRVNAAGYFYDYGNYQAYTNFPGGLGSATVNAQAENKGIELEVQASPLDGLDFHFGVGYADVQVTDVIGFPGETLTSVNTPKWTVNGLVRYAFDIGNAGELALQADASYKSEHYFGLSVTPAVTEDGYTLVNFGATWTPMAANWSFGLSLENALNEEYIVQTFDLSDWIGMVQEYYGKPRWLRAKLSWDF